MSLTLHWDGKTYLFESRSKARGAVHLNAQVVERLRSHIHLVRTGILGAEANNPAILKVARGTEEIDALEKEAGLYETELKGLRGKHVPEYYGIYHGEVLDCPMACMILEYCSGQKLPLYERNRKVMLAACALHAAGIMHCDLVSGHHMVMSGKDIKIVDFSRAVPHRCYNATPTLHHGHGGNSDGCRELLQLEATYGIFSGEAFPLSKPLAINPFAEGNSLQELARRFVGMVMPAQ